MRKLKNKKYQYHKKKMKMKKKLHKPKGEIYNHFFSKYSFL